MVNSYKKYLPTTFLAWGNLLMLISAAGWNFIDNDHQAQNFSEGVDNGAYLVISMCYFFAALFDLGFLWGYMTGNSLEKFNQRLLLLASCLNVACGFETVLGCYLRYLYVSDPKFTYLSWSYTLDFITSIVWAVDAVLFLVGYRLIDARDSEGRVIWCPTMNFTLLADVFSVLCCVLYAAGGFCYYQVYVTYNANEDAWVDMDSDSLQALMYTWAVEMGAQADFSFLTCCILLCIDNINSVRYAEAPVIQTTRRDSIVHAKLRKESGFPRFSTRAHPLLRSINSELADPTLH